MVLKGGKIPPPLTHTPIDTHTSRVYTTEIKSLKELNRFWLANDYAYEFVWNNAWNDYK